MKIKQYLHEKASRPVSTEFDTEEADEITDVYANYVIETAEDFKKNGISPLVLVEQRVDYSFIAPGGFGTSDAVIIGVDENGIGILHICDLKAGRGVYVEADHNTQMMLYALGALHAFGFIYNVQKVLMTIIQPRLENIGTFEMDAEELMKWGESIKPIARLAYEGKGEQHPGDWCRFCKAKAHCKACAAEALALTRSEFVDLDANDEIELKSSAGKEGNMDDKDGKNSVSGAAARDNSEDCVADAGQVDKDQTSSVPVFKRPDQLTNEQIENLLPTLNRISAWIEAVFAYVSSEAINHGVKWRGYKVVEGRSKRQFTNEDEVAKAAMDAGYSDIYSKSLLPLTKIEKLMGKKKFKEVLGNYVVKPPGKLTLVEDNDPREEVEIGAGGGVDTGPSAADDFGKV